MTGVRVPVRILPSTFSKPSISGTMHRILPNHGVCNACYPVSRAHSALFRDFGLSMEGFSKDTSYPTLRRTGFSIGPSSQPDGPGVAARPSLLHDLSHRRAGRPLSAHRSWGVSHHQLAMKWKKNFFFCFLASHAVLLLLHTSTVVLVGINGMAETLSSNPI